MGLLLCFIQLTSSRTIINNLCLMNPINDVNQRIIHKFNSIPNKAPCTTPRLNWKERNEVHAPSPRGQGEIHQKCLMACLSLRKWKFLLYHYLGPHQSSVLVYFVVWPPSHQDTLSKTTGTLLICNPLRCILLDDSCCIHTLSKFLNVCINNKWNFHQIIMPNM